MGHLQESQQHREEETIKEGQYPKADQRPTLLFLT
jgi:hypothetical protein